MHTWSRTAEWVGFATFTCLALYSTTRGEPVPDFPLPPAPNSPSISWELGDHNLLESVLAETRQPQTVTVRVDVYCGTVVCTSGNATENNRPATPNTIRIHLNPPVNVHHVTGVTVTELK